MNRSAAGFDEGWRAVLPAATAGVLAWTLFCLIGWAAVTLGGTLLEAIIEIFFFWAPPLSDALQAVVHFLAGLGSGVVGIAWAIGAAVIALGAYALRYGDGVTFTYRETIFRGPGRTAWPDERSMKDVTPPRGNRDDDRRNLLQ